MHPFCNTTASSKQSVRDMHMVRRGRDSARSAWHGSIHAVEALRVQSGVLGPGLGMDGFLQNMKIGIIIRYDHWAESANQGCRLRTHGEFRKF